MTKSKRVNYQKTDIEEIPKEWTDNSLDKYLNYIKRCLFHLYRNESFLFKYNLSERCIAFRFAHLLQNIFKSEYFVDCDYNSSTYYDATTKLWVRRNGKPIRNQETGKLEKKFIDIIVHKRKAEFNSDLICFEIKKWNNCEKNSVKKDLNNLRVLTAKYGYIFGFHLIFGETFENTKITIFRNGVKRTISII